MVHTEPHIKKGFFLIFKNDGIPPCSHNPVTLPLCPVAVSRVAEGGGQAGGGAAGVQVAQGPRDPARPAHRQAGGADRQGGHVISPPSPWGRAMVAGRRRETRRGGPSQGRKGEINWASFPHPPPPPPLGSDQALIPRWRLSFFFFRFFPMTRHAPSLVLKHGR